MKTEMLETIEDGDLELVAGGFAREVSYSSPLGNVTYDKTVATGEGKSVSWSVFGASGGHSIR